MFEVDYKKFKVICQKCGKVGEIDTFKPENERSFFKRWDERRGNKWNEPILDYYLCRECLEL